MQSPRVFDSPAAGRCPCIGCILAISPGHCPGRAPRQRPGPSRSITAAGHTEFQAHPTILMGPSVVAHRIAKTRLGGVARSQRAWLGGRIRPGCPVCAFTPATEAGVDDPGRRLPFLTGISCAPRIFCTESRPQRVLILLSKVLSVFALFNRIRVRPARPTAGIVEAKCEWPGRSRAAVSHASSHIGPPPPFLVRAIVMDIDRLARRPVRHGGDVFVPAPTASAISWTATWAPSWQRQAAARLAHQPSARRSRSTYAAHFSYLPREFRFSHISSLVSRFCRTCLSEARRRG